ncbi:MAG TPA: hypothetical protein VJ654_17590 [Noviherbaspirillum sp.]|nr:hypothetical protein [Noviherbaspirillum sp.]
MLNTEGESMITGIWQEYDCSSGIDFDLCESEILAEGESCYCSGCGGHHVAGKDGPTETFVEHDSGELEYRGLPKDAEEKAAWLASIGA